MFENPTTVVAMIKKLEWQVVYDLCLMQAAHTAKVTYNSSEQKSGQNVMLAHI